MTIEGVGPQHAKAADGTDPRGWLVFEYLPPGLQNAEDSRLAADNAWFSTAFGDRIEEVAGVGAMAFAPKGLAWWSRRATDTEKALLAQLGYTVPDDLRTVVSYATPGVRRRRWPQLENQTPNPQPQGE